MGIVELSKKLNKLIEAVEHELASFSYDKLEYTFEDIITYSDDKLRKILDSYQIDNYDEIFTLIDLYKESLTDDESTFTKTLAKIKQKIEKLVDEMNIKADTKFEEAKNRASSLKAKLENIKLVQDALSKTNLENIDLVTEAILKLELEEAEKLEILSVVTINYIDYLNKVKFEKSKQELADFENAVAEAESIIQEEEKSEKVSAKYNQQFIADYISSSPLLFGRTIISDGEIFDFNISDDELNEFLETDQLDDDYYVIGTCTLLIKLSNTDEKNTDIIADIKEKLSKLKASSAKFHESMDKINAKKKGLEDLINYATDILKTMFRNNHNNSTELAALQIELSEIEIRKENEDELDELLDKAKKLTDKIKNINENKHRQGNDEERTVEFKAFVLFDYFIDYVSAEMIPYVVKDLDKNSTRNLIDSAVPQNKLDKCYKDYVELVEDLILYDKPRVILAGSSSDANGDNRIVSPIFDEKGNPTGLLRIRPHFTSHVRFAEDRIVLKKDSKILKQVINLLSENLGAKIPEEELPIYINYASFFKQSEKGGYDKAISRSLQSNIKNMLSKDELNEEELKQMEQIIALSIDVLRSRLKSIDGRFEFENIDAIIGGEKKHGV